MINLEPIPKLIQERLKEKQRILGRENTIGVPLEQTGAGQNSRLTFEKMNRRTTFLRMTSGQLNPIILMGGKVKDDGSIPAGYDDIYGPRNYKVGGKTVGDLEVSKGAPNNPLFGPQPDDVVTSVLQPEAAEQYILENKFKRPTPGVKSIDVSFQGGSKATREATIQWTCWDWTELGLLTPHFLSHGKTVLVEWGWIYGETEIQNLPNFLDTDSAGNRFINANVYNNYKNDVIDANGDFDLMVGIIKNFEFVTRDDGGFDCTTILTSVGVNIIENQEGDRRFVDPSQVYNVDIQNDKETTDALKNIGNGNQEQILLGLNTTVSLKAFINQIDKYLLTLVDLTEATSGGLFPIYSESNKFIFNTILKTDRRETEVEINVNQAWVRWGWFEDNILSKFLSLTSQKDITSVFRSVERVVRSDGQETDLYESVKIRNNPNLETVDINAYILPGQFRPLQSRTIDVSNQTGERFGFDDEITIKGDDTRLISLSTIINDPNQFEPFSTGENDGETIERFATRQVEEEKTISTRGGAMNVTQTRNVTGVQEIPSPGRFGYLRNMLINTKLIKQAFGADELDGKIESINVFEAIQSMFNLINQAGGLNMWNYQLVQDDTDHQRVKIVDDTTTKIDVNGDLEEQTTKFDVNGKISQGDGGIYYFPVWRSDSIVKRQGITASIPSELQIATMYGSNVDAIKEFGNHSANFGAEGVIAGALDNSQKDRRLKGVNLAIKNKNSINIGLKSGDSSEEITLKDGEDILTFLQSETIQDLLTKSYGEIAEDIEEKIKRQEKLEKDNRIADLYDPTKPVSSIEFLGDEEIASLLDFDNLDDTKLSPNQVQSLIEDIEEQFGRKFVEGKMKSNFLSFVNDFITNFGNTNNESITQIIPFELELDIDGIGGIYPGNAFNSLYIPQRYQDTVVFQAKDVNHKLDSSGWTTTIIGVMRTSLQKVFNGNQKFASLKTDLDNLRGKLAQKLARERLEQQEKNDAAFEKFGNATSNVGRGVG